MFSFVTVLHILVCLLLGLIILMQSGRGGGLTETFSGAESMLGPQTNVFLVKTTTVFSVLFLVTCLSLAAMSSRREESLMSRRIAAPSAAPVDLPISQDDVQKMMDDVVEQTGDVAPVPEVPSVQPATPTAP